MGTIDSLVLHCTAFSKCCAMQCPTPREIVSNTMCVASFLFIFDSVYVVMVRLGTLFKQASGLCLELVLISVAILAQGCKLTEVDFEVCSEFKSMQPAMKPDAKRSKSIPVWKPKGTVATALAQGSQTADPPCTTPQYGLPIDGGAGGQSPSKPQYGLPTDGGAGGPSAAASSSSAGPAPPSASSSSAAPPSPPLALEGETWRERKQSRDQLRAEARKLMRPPASYNPQGYLDVPPLCNRIANPWGEKPAVCVCGSEWPKFFSAALSSGQVQTIKSTKVRHGTLTIEPGIKPGASYRRPGGHNMTHRWWYNAVVEELAKVTDKYGHTKAIAIVN